jgi:trans-aconitate methyltransferase
MIELAQRILSSRGIHYVVTRFGGNQLRSLSFDGKFKRGQWIFKAENPQLVRLVERYSAGGHILALGCGTAPIAGRLSPGSYQSFLGVDMSGEAIRMAQQWAGGKIRFEVGDMLQHRCERNYDVILFPNSFYYVSWWSRLGFLKRLAASLTSNGRIIITLAQPVRYARILRTIRRAFVVDVDRELQNHGGHVLAFR